MNDLIKFEITAENEPASPAELRGAWAFRAELPLLQKFQLQQAFEQANRLSLSHFEGQMYSVAGAGQVIAIQQYYMLYMAAFGAALVVERPADAPGFEVMASAGGYEAALSLLGKRLLTAQMTAEIEKKKRGLIEAINTLSDLLPATKASEYPPVPDGLLPPSLLVWYLDAYGLPLHSEAARSLTETQLLEERLLLLANYVNRVNQERLRDGKDDLMTLRRIETDAASGALSEKVKRIQERQAPALEAFMADMKAAEEKGRYRTATNPYFDKTLHSKAK